MWSYSTKKETMYLLNKGQSMFVRQCGQFTPSPGKIFLSENRDVLFSHASFILIPFPLSTHPFDPLFFLLAWILDLWCEKLQHPGVRQEESPSVIGLNVLPTHIVERVPVEVCMDPQMWRTQTLQ